MFKPKHPPSYFCSFPKDFTSFCAHQAHTFTSTVICTLAFWTDVRLLCYPQWHFLWSWTISYILSIIFTPFFSTLFPQFFCFPGFRTFFHSSHFPPNCAPCSHNCPLPCSVCSLEWWYRHYAFIFITNTLFWYYRQIRTRQTMNSSKKQTRQTTNSSNSYLT